MLCFASSNTNSLNNFFQIAEDPRNPGTYFGVDAPDFSPNGGSHTAGRIIALTGPPTLNPTGMVVLNITSPTFGTPTAEPAPQAPRSFDSDPFASQPQPPQEPPSAPSPSPQLDRFANAFASPAPAVASPPPAPARPSPMPSPEAPPAPNPNVSPFSPSTGIPAGLPEAERLKHERARRLARVLASDIAIYNKEKRDRGIQDGLPGLAGGRGGVASLDQQARHLRCPLLLGWLEVVQSLQVPEQVNPAPGVQGISEVPVAGVAVADDDALVAGKHAAGVDRVR